VFSLAGKGESRVIMLAGSWQEHNKDPVFVYPPASPYSYDENFHKRLPGLNNFFVFKAFRRF
jgi:hypothetical protein